MRRVICQVGRSSPLNQPFSPDMRYFQYLRKSTDDSEHQVLSLESQEREISRRFADDPDIEIVETVVEKQSAKVPGRPLFNSLLDRIERGEAEGIVSWVPDRLARNSVDGGRIIYLLDTGKLKDLKFASYFFQNTPHGKYILQIDFANAKLHVDSLSANVRMGNQTKIERGWRANGVPIGYLNVDRKGPAPIVPDPDRFPLVKRLWEYALSGAYSVPQLLRIATDQWGLRTRKRRKSGGKPLTHSGIYRLLGNPFYAGILRHHGKDYPGKHPAMVTLSEFMTVQKQLRRPDAPRSRHHAWDYTGLMKCKCGRSITAEHTMNRFGTKYVYYHCTRRRGAERCAEPYVELRTLEAQFRTFIESVTLSPKRHAWALERGSRRAATIRKTLDAQKTALDRALRETEAAQKNLRYLRIHDQISDVEFTHDRNELAREETRLRQEIDQVSPANLVEPEHARLLLSVRALEWFDKGDGATRRLLLETMGSNPTLSGGKVSIDAAFPFTRNGARGRSPTLCTVGNDVRTLTDRSALRKVVIAAKLIAERIGERFLTEDAA